MYGFIAMMWFVAAILAAMLSVDAFAQGHVLVGVLWGIAWVLDSYLAGKSFALFTEGD